MSRKASVKLRVMISSRPSGLQYGEQRTTSKVRGTGRDTYSVPKMKVRRGTYLLEKGKCWWCVRIGSHCVVVCGVAAPAFTPPPMLDTAAMEIGRVLTGREDVGRL